MSVPTLYERGAPGRSGVDLPACDVPQIGVPAKGVRVDNGLPELSQLEVVRHYTALAQRNFGIDSGFYPLGSCTMKYNPRLGESLARQEGFADVHPLQAEGTVQGCLALMCELQDMLARIGGFERVSLQPSAGAHGELTALLMIRAWHADRGEGRRSRVLVPDSAHGTNPASTTMAGYLSVEIPSDARGNLDLAALEAACDDGVAALMLTNPNTLGLFEEHVLDVADIVHRSGAVLYGDGANLNALAGVVRPADLGIDLMHYNLHKTFATPHGGGGPGSGPVGARGALADYLPGPVVVRRDADAGSYALEVPPRSIGRVASFHGNFGMFVRALAYLKVLGGDGLAQHSMHAVLNANYLRVRLRELFQVPYDRTCMHEFVCRGNVEGSTVRALDISKRLLDNGFHPPTNYFPLIVPEALMIEPTETESLQTLDAFVDALARIREECKSDPAYVQAAPHRMPVARLDEVRAARTLVVSAAPSTLPVDEEPDADQ